ncbi:MAG: R3H domain-containing nucleic acid-binding protein [Dermatophilaceae bacterium]|nr:RNA-binding protein [Intrasporangiaceae bacterium]
MSTENENPDNPESPENDGPESDSAGNETAVEESFETSDTEHQGESLDALVEKDAAEGEAEVASDPETSSTVQTEDERPAKPSRREALEAEGDVAADFLEALLDIADIVGDIDVDIDGDRAAVSIVDSDEGRVPRRLVGPDGKVLEALQELTRLAVQSETGERSRLMLDVAGHRAGRRTEIVEIAQRVIAEVKETGEQGDMDPMTAFERKIVHDEVLAAGLRSESEGVEPHRYVIVLPGT